MKKYKIFAPESDSLKFWGKEDKVFDENVLDLETGGEFQGKIMVSQFPQEGYEEAEIQVGQRLLPGDWYITIIEREEEEEPTAITLPPTKPSEIVGGEKPEGREILRINVDLACSGECESCEKFYECELPRKYQMFQRSRMIQARERMSKIKHKIAIASGKGGVGKSICTINIAAALALKGNEVTILDQDFDGHSVPQMLGILDKRHTLSDNGVVPVTGNLGIQAVSMGLILKDEDVLIWFHKMRRGATEEFISHVAYGERDYLMVDLPPGTGSDSVNTMQYIPDLDGVVVVTVPSEVSQNVARKTILLARKAKVKVLGVIENMSGFACPNCGKISYVLQQGGGEKMAESMGVPLLGRIPMDPRLSESCDRGEPFVALYPESPASKEITRIVEHLEELVDGGSRGK